MTRSTTKRQPRVIRLLLLREMLLRDPDASTADLAKVLEVTQRAVQRDLHLLADIEQQVGEMMVGRLAPHAYQRKGGGRSLLETRFGQ